MFEKEAEEYFRENAYNFDEVTACRECMEFGYNKANEWHDLRKDPNDLPIFETELLCQKYSGRCFVGYYHYNDNKFYPYEKGNSYDVTDVIAWKEIVLPELGLQMPMQEG